MTDRDDYPANPYRGRARRGGGDDYDPLTDPLPAQPPSRGRRARPEPPTDHWADPSASGGFRHTGPSSGEFRTPRYASPAAGDYSELYPSDPQPRPQPGRRRRAQPPEDEAPWSGEQPTAPPRRFGVVDAVRGSRAARGGGDQGYEPGFPSDTGSHQRPAEDPTQDALAALADLGGSPGGPADPGDRGGPGHGPVDAVPPEEPPRRPRRARAEEPEQARSPFWGDDLGEPTPAFLADTPDDEPKGRRARRKRAKQAEAEAARDTGSFAAPEQEEPGGRRGRRRARRAAEDEPRDTGAFAAAPAGLPEEGAAGSGAFALPEDDEPVGRRSRRRSRRAEPEPEPEPEVEDTVDEGSEGDGEDEDDYEEERLEDIAAAYGNSRANRKRAKKAKAAQAARRSGGRSKKRKRKGPMILLALVLMLVVAGGGFGVMRTFVFPPDFDGEGEGEVVVTIEEGQSGTAVAQSLVDEGVVASVRSFTNALSALPDEEEGDGLVPGTYSLAEGMSGEHAVAALFDSDNRLGGRVTLREGLRGSQILQELADSTGVPVEEFQEAYGETDDLGLPDYATEGPEGYLFPATYSFEPDTEPIAMLRTMVTQYDQIAEEADLEGRAAELGYDPNEAMAIASIIQAESGDVDDMAKVSRVVHNRLDIDMPLQMDSTCFYAIGEYGIALDNDQLAACEEDESGFDTYHQTGLIPGPFVAPGEDAIEAALDPEEGDWLYFVATDPENGVTEFTDNHDEFEILKERFQENWGGGEGAEEGGE
ncbi:endolytic transglycosylase MltG [Nocardiopsis oceani]